MSVPPVPLPPAVSAIRVTGFATPAAPSPPPPPPPPPPPSALCVGGCGVGCECTGGDGAALGPGVAACASSDAVADAAVAFCCFTTYSMTMPMCTPRNSATPDTVSLKTSLKEVHTAATSASTAVVALSTTATARSTAALMDGRRAAASRNALHQCQCYARVITAVVWPSGVK